MGIMSTTNGLLLDANAWLALVVEGHPHHSAMNLYWKRVSPHTLRLFCRVTQMSLLRLLCNKQVMGESRLTMIRAWGVFDELMSAENTLLIDELDGEHHESEWRKLTQTKASSGSAWTDAYLAAFASIGNFSILTFDQGFRKYSSIHTIILNV